MERRSLSIRSSSWVSVKPPTCSRPQRAQHAKHASACTASAMPQCSSTCLHPFAAPRQRAPARSCTPASNHPTHLLGARGCQTLLQPTRFGVGKALHVPEPAHGLQPAQPANSRATASLNISPAARPAPPAITAAHSQPAWQPGCVFKCPQPGRRAQSHTQQHSVHASPLHARCMLRTHQPISRPSEGLGHLSGHHTSPVP